MDEISNGIPTFRSTFRDTCRLGGFLAACLFMVGVPPRAISNGHEAFPTPAIDTAVFAVG